MTYEIGTQSSPLTTVFVPPASCNCSTWTWRGGTGLTSIYQDSLESLDDGKDCFSSDFFGVGGTWSPGICPSGYAATALKVISNSVSSVLCCPT